MNGDRYDLVVIGAGVFGLSTALEAATRGRRVLVVERGPLPNPAAASTAPSRKLHSTYADVAYSRLAVNAIAGWERIERDSGQIIYLRLGNLVYTATDDLTTLDLLGSNAELAGASIERLDRAALRDRFPLFRLAKNGIVERDGGVLLATRACEAIAELGRRAGVTIRPSMPVARLDLDGSLPATILEGGERLSSEHVVIAAGVWTPRLIQELRPFITLKKEGMAYLRDLPRSFDATGVFPFTELETIFYGFPRLGDDPIKIGWHQYGEVTTDPDADRAERSMPLLDGVSRFLHDHFGLDIPTARIAGDTCIYDLTPTSDFLIDFVPGCSTVLAVTGGSGHAFKFGSVIGRLAMDRLDGIGGAWLPQFGWEHMTGTSRRDRPDDVLFGGASQSAAPIEY